MNTTNLPKTKAEKREEQLGKSSEMSPKVHGSPETPYINEYRFRHAEAERLEKKKNAIYYANEATLAVDGHTGGHTAYVEMDRLQALRIAELTRAAAIFNSNEYQLEVQRERALGHVEGASVGTANASTDGCVAEERIHRAKELSRTDEDLETIETVFKYFLWGLTTTDHLDRHERSDTRTVAASLTNAWVLLHRSTT